MAFAAAHGTLRFARARLRLAKKKNQIYLLLGLSEAKLEWGITN
jgi:hypothetical protein